MQSRNTSGISDQDGRQEEAINPSVNSKLQALPSDAMGCILNQISDATTLMNLAASNPAMKIAIFQQGWTCRNCHTCIFIDPQLNSASPQAHFFMCFVCHGKFCGERVDYDKRHCRRQTCSGCGQVECHACMEAHLGNDDGYGTENYCQECQDKFEFNMGGC